MTLTAIISDLWSWFRIDLVGSDIMAGTIVAVYVFACYSAMDLPIPAAVGLSLPTIFAVILLGFLGWFGWLALVLAGLLFGVIVYKWYGVR